MKNWIPVLATMAALLIVVGAYFFPLNHEVAPSVTASPAGTTLSTSKIAEQILTVSTTTVFSVLNSDANDRTIVSVDAFVTNGQSTTTSYSITCATSSAATGVGPTTSTAFSVTFANGGIFGTTTSSGGAFVSTTTPGVITTSSNFARNWVAGSYLVCKSTASANNNLFDQNVTGFVSFTYRGQ